MRKCIVFIAFSMKEPMKEKEGDESDSTSSYFEPRICVIGSGRLSATLALLFRARYSTVLFDTGRAYPDDIEKIRHCNVYVVVVPATKKQDSHTQQPPLLKVCEILGKVISGGNIVVCETTQCSAVSGEECISLIEQMSGLTCHSDFFAGCSPGWSNGLDYEHSAAGIREESFRTTPEIGKIVREIYSAVMA